MLKLLNSDLNSISGGVTDNLLIVDLNARFGVITSVTHSPTLGIKNGAINGHENPIVFGTIHGKEF